jgi:hypothetical protein
MSPRWPRSLVLLLSSFVVPAVEISCIHDLSADLTADEIVARHVEALGGPEALKAVETMKISGSWVFVGEAISMTIVRKRPDSFHFQIADATGSRAVQASDGRTSWQYTNFPSVSLSVLEQRDAETFYEEWGDFDGPLVDYAAKGHSIELVGKENLESVETYHLKLRLQSGREQHYFVNAKNFALVRKMVTSYNRSGGETSPRAHDRIYYYDEFAKVGNILVPRYFEREDGGEHVWAYEFDHVELNPPVDNTLFVMPEGIPVTEGRLPGDPL